MCDKLAYYRRKLRNVIEILNNQIQLMSETCLFSLTMTSVISHWLTAKPFVLCLYKRDTTGMVGRPVNSTAMYTSLLKEYLLNI